MPAQKHSEGVPPTSPSPPSSPPLQEPEEKEDDSPEHDPNLNGEQADEDEEGDGAGEDSDDSVSSSDDDQKDEYIFVRLSEIRKEVQCPICLGIIRKTRTVMECLHRFCRECIDKSMRLGNNECPACRTHCASRRSLRDDPNYDKLIAVMYPDIDKYEEEELAFHEEEIARNKQIQDSIAQTFRRQTEALGKKRSARISRRTANYRNVRTRRSQRTSEHQGSDEEDDANGNYGGKDSSSADERSPEVKTSRHRRWSGARYPQSSAAANSDAGNDENESEVNREVVGASASASASASFLGASASLLGSPDILAWGKLRSRSNSRHGGSGSRGKFSRKNRLNKLMECLRSSARANEELDVSLELVAIDNEDMPNLQRPYLSCKPTLSIKHLCQYVAVQTSTQAEELEIWWKKELKKEFPSEEKSELLIASPVLDMFKYDQIRLAENQTLGEIRNTFSSSQCNLVLAYKRRQRHI